MQNFGNICFPTTHQSNDQGLKAIYLSKIWWCLKNVRHQLALAHECIEGHRSVWKGYMLQPL